MYSLDLMQQVALTECAVWTRFSERSPRNWLHQPCDKRCSNGSGGCLQAGCYLAGFPFCWPWAHSLRTQHQSRRHQAHRHDTNPGTGGCCGEHDKPFDTLVPMPNSLSMSLEHLVTCVLDMTQNISWSTIHHSWHFWDPSKSSSTIQMWLHAVQNCMLQISIQSSTRGRIKFWGTILQILPCWHQNLYGYYFAIPRESMSQFMIVRR